MRVKLLTIGMTLALTVALVAELTPGTVLGQDNTNQSNANSSRRRRGRRPPPAPQPAAEQAQPAQPEPAATEAQATQQPARRRARRGSRRMAGVPKGVQNCIDHLTEMASADPLVAYEGHPSEIINNGLLWDDPKSKCSIGSDASLRLKVSNLARAWQLKDAATVRSLLGEIKSAAPQ